MAAHRPSGRGARGRAAGVASSPASTPTSWRSTRTGSAPVRPSGSTTCPAGVDRLVAPSEGIVHTWVNGVRDLARRRRGPRRGRGTAPAERGDPGMSRRDEILGVAKAQIAERGYGNTSMRDIAEANGLLAGSLYSHFRSKAEIVRDIVIRFYDELLPAQQAVIDGERHGCRQVPRHGRCGPRGVQPAPRGADDPALRLAHALRSRRAVRRARPEPADARPLEGGDRGGQGRRLDPLHRRRRGDGAHRHQLDPRADRHGPVRHPPGARERHTGSRGAAPGGAADRHHRPEPARTKPARRHRPAVVSRPPAGAGDARPADHRRAGGGRHRACRAALADVAIADGRVVGIGRHRGERAPAHDRRRRARGRAGHRRRAHALRPADHLGRAVRHLRPPRRDDGGRRQLRVRRRAVPGRRPRLPRPAVRPGGGHGPRRPRPHRVGVRDLPRVPRVPRRPARPQLRHVRGALGRPPLGPGRRRLRAGGHRRRGGGDGRPRRRGDGGRRARLLVVAGADPPRSGRPPDPEPARRRSTRCGRWPTRSAVTGEDRSPSRPRARSRASRPRTATC